MKDVQYNAPQCVNLKNGIEIVYDSFGSPTSPPILLIAGLGDQMISWPDGFCEQIARNGYWVIRFDNRDAGLSTRFDGKYVPGLFWLIWDYILGHTQSVPYTLEDMAQDTIGLVDWLGLESAHIVGGSLGGMIAEMCAIKHPQRVKTLTVFMSTVCDPWLAPPQPKALILFKSPPNNREGNIRHIVKVKRTLRGNGFRFDENYVCEQASRLYTRCQRQANTNRQMAALLASLKDLKKELHAIRVPTLVLHGSNDPLVPVKHGIQTARSIPGAKLKIINGLGHELPVDAWTQVIEAITSHLGRVFEK